MRTLRLLSVLTFLLFSSSFSWTADTPHSASSYEKFYKNAETALEKGNRKVADFWMARYLGTASLDPKTSKGSQDLSPLLKKRGLIPRAFIPGNWDKDFLDWFVRSLYPRWGAEEKRVKEEIRFFEIAEAVWKNQYFVTVSASPELRSWFILESDVTSKELIMALGDPAERPTVFFGKLMKNTLPFAVEPLALETEGHALHYLWKPEFFDLDGDGVPEVWLRYNLVWGNGFTQVLEIYKIKDESRLVLLKRFRGEHEGFARRIEGGKVEVASGFASRSGLPEMSPDKDRVETWQYSKGEFKKISQNDIPNVLLSPEWKKYYGVS